VKEWKKGKIYFLKDLTRIGIFPYHSDPCPQLILPFFEGKLCLGGMFFDEIRDVASPD